MSKLTISTIASLTNEQSVISLLNDNFDSIEDFADNSLSRDGTSPNQMEAQLDMNSNRIINLAGGVDVNDAVTMAQLEAAGTYTAGTAPSTASYLTLGTSSLLDSERVLTAGTNITLTDAGAGSTLTVSLPSTLSGNTTLTGTTTYSSWSGAASPTPRISMGSVIDNSGDVSVSHIALWSTTFGFGISAASLNYLVQSGSTHNFFTTADLDATHAALRIGAYNTDSTTTTTGAVLVRGGLGLTNRITAGGIIKTTDTTTSTTSTTGSGIFGGGVGIAENLHVGGTSTFTGAVTLTGGVTGALTATTDIRGRSLKSNTAGSTGGIGYTAAAGGTTVVVQATSKATGVTQNALAGIIQTHNANLNAATTASFTFTNNCIADGDTLILNWEGAGATFYVVTAGTTDAGSVVIYIRNVGGNAAEVVNIQYAILKNSGT